MSRTVCGYCLCPYGDDGQCACVEEQAMTTEAEVRIAAGNAEQHLAAKLKDALIAQQAAEIDKANALLRQALVALHEGMVIDSDFDLMNATVAAIKQHLGGQSD